MPTGSHDNHARTLNSGSDAYKSALPDRGVGKCGCDSVTQSSSSSSSSSASSSSPSSPSSSSSSSSSLSKSSSSSSASSLSASSSPASPSSDIRGAWWPRADPSTASSRTPVSSIATPCIIICHAPWPVAADRLRSAADDPSRLRLCDDADISLRRFSSAGTAARARRLQRSQARSARR
ncbi:MAG: hypothetical protein C0476_04060 [Sphingomonas sp.]|nr:hypothetical protein [Sphingomonas sp.]